MKNFRGYRLALASVALLGMLLSLTLPLAAQDATGKVVGTVTDQQGAVVAGAKVTVTNTATSVNRETVTGSDGTYLINALPIGNYTITVQKDGFTKAVSGAQQLFINQNLRTDMKLAVGSSTETVEVQAQAAGVETINSTLGQSVTSRPLVNLPLNGRNVYQLALLQPGVGETNPDNTGQGAGFSIAGGRTDSVTYLLDGGLNNNLLNNAPVFTPNPDTIAEFRILTSNYTAEFGRNGGGIISVVTKSGTNSLHGSAFEFIRNDALNANSYTNKIKGLPREVLKRNQFGGTLGGPVIKNKFFIFGGYQGQRLRNAVANDAPPTFTPLELGGNFSKSGKIAADATAPAGSCEATTSVGGKDCNVVNFLTANSYFQPNAALAAQGIIDPTKFDPVALKYIAAGLIPSSASGILSEQGAGKSDNDELTLKFDFNISDRDKLSVTTAGSHSTGLANYRSAGNTGGIFSESNKFPISNTATRYFGNFSYTHIFTSSILNEARLTAQRIHTISFKPAATLPNPAALSVGVTPDLSNGPTRIEFASGLTLGFSPNGPQDIVNNTFVYSDTLSWTKGKHNWKFGFNFSPYQNNTVYDYYGTGDFFFSGANGIGSGNDLADFLFGLPDEYLQFGNAPSNIRSKSYYGFAQDEWHVRNNLTLTLGIRYEYSTPKLDTQGRSFSLKLGQQSTVFTNAPIGVLFPGDAGAPNGANFPDRNDWAPRFGFAWDPFHNGKTSIRGGIGLFYDILKGEDNLQFNGQAPFFGYSDLFFDPLSANPTGPVGYTTTPYLTNDSDGFGTPTPNSFPSKPPASNIDFGAAGFLPFGGGGVYFVDPHLRTPYTYQYNLSIQRQIVPNLTFESSYVGSRSKKLTLLVDSNPYVLGTSKRLFNTPPSGVPGNFGRLDTFKNVGNAYYDSLQTSLTKQTSDTKWLGKSYFTLAYTWAHNIDTSSGYRQRNSKVPYYNPNLFRASSDFDIRHRITLSGGWDLPLDRKWSNRLTKGWSLYPILTYRTGFALDVLAGLPAKSGLIGPSGVGDRELVRASLVGPLNLLDPKSPQSVVTNSGVRYFNTTNFVPGVCSSPNDDPADPTNCLAAITNPALRTYGGVPRNFFRGPDRTNFDLAIAKNTQVYERLNMEFRAELFNAFNNTQFSNPDTNINSGTFGQITSTADPRIIQFAVRFTF